MEAPSSVRLPFVPPYCKQAFLNPPKLQRVRTRPLLDYAKTGCIRADAKAQESEQPTLAI